MITLSGFVLIVGGLLLGKTLATLVGVGFILLALVVNIASH